MKLIIGLGNPDEGYANNRHNVGHKLIDVLQDELPEDAKAEKTDVYMNESGEYVARQKNFYKVDLDDLYVVYDDLDIPLGSYKISKGKSPRVHNGIISVIEKLGSEDFWHVRIGIEHRTKDMSKAPMGMVEHRQTGKEYVLQDFTEEEMKILADVIEKVCAHLTQSFVIAK